MTALRLMTGAAAIWAGLAGSMLLGRPSEAEQLCLAPSDLSVPAAAPALAKPLAPAAQHSPPRPASSVTAVPLRLPCLKIVPWAPDAVPALTAEQQRDLERCRAGSGVHCRAIHVTFNEKHPALATEASRLLCGQGRKSSCAELGRRVARGLGVEADLDAGVALMREACATDPKACFELALELRSVLPDEALEAARRGCGVGRAIQCKQAGDLASRGAGGSTPSEAAAWYDAACERGNHDGCEELLELSERGALGPVDARLLVQRRARACAVGFRAACGPR